MPIHKNKKRHLANRLIIGAEVPKGYSVYSSVPWLLRRMAIGKKVKESQKKKS